jgi:hypothetical protein
MNLAVSWAYQDAFNKAVQEILKNMPKAMEVFDRKENAMKIYQVAEGHLKENGFIASADWLVNYQILMRDVKGMPDHRVNATWSPALV